MIIGDKKKVILILNSLFFLLLEKKQFFILNPLFFKKFLILFYNQFFINLNDKGISFLFSDIFKYDPIIYDYFIKKLEFVFLKYGGKVVTYSGSILKDGQKDSHVSDVINRYYYDHRLGRDCKIFLHGNIIDNTSYSKMQFLKKRFLIRYKEYTNEF